jgi:uncharacterized membrane-anchored protein
MKSPFFWLLAAAALLQWLVPANMIWGRERTLREGRLYRFRCAPVDPADPFRGRYLVLSFGRASAPCADSSEAGYQQQAWLLLEEDSAGFATYRSLHRKAPGAGEALKVKIRDRDWEDSTRTLFDLPFDRFYLEESQALEAEQQYIEQLRDSSTQVWAEVYVRDGEAVLSDVKINGRSVRELPRQPEGGE